MKRVLLLGSSGFVGQHLAAVLDTAVELVVTSRVNRKATGQTIHFDLNDTSTWSNILAVAPDIIINSSGYGVVKDQTDLAVMYEVNYQAPMKLAQFMQQAGQRPYWIQIGTAFEYDLEAEALTEDSATLPTTHYGISKMLFSSFLQSQKNRLPYTLLRPFAMFGPYESASKFIPYLINAQVAKEPVSLSSGLQQRDYFYVRDLASFVKKLVLQPSHEYAGQLFNIGTGSPISIIALAREIAEAIPDFNANYWQWNKIPQRTNENEVFFNSSTKAFDGGLELTLRAIAIQETVNYYFNNV